MVEEELKANKQLTEFVVHDLNKEPTLPFPDNSFDVITNCVRCVGGCGGLGLCGVGVWGVKPCIGLVRGVWGCPDALWPVVSALMMQTAVTEGHNHNSLNLPPLQPPPRPNSVDYLNRPLEVFTEMHRVLKPGGRAIMSFSNRCFPTKAIALWTATGDEGACRRVEGARS